jgi:hypothetical protein
VDDTSFASYFRSDKENLASRRFLVRYQPNGWVERALPIAVVKLAMAASHAREPDYAYLDFDEEYTKLLPLDSIWQGIFACFRS